MTAPVQLSLKAVDKFYGAIDHGVHAVRSINMDVMKGDIIALLGSSGCGKTSTLRMIAGFEEVSRGTIELAGRQAQMLPPVRRNVAMAFEGYSLYPTVTVRETFATLKSNKALAILDPECWSQYDKDESPEARKALKARFDELVKEGRIDFVTFHQSFSYEDFVEGIRAESDGDRGQLTYDVVDGVFKRMCDAVAAKVTRSDSHEAMTLEGRRVWKMSLGNTKGDDAHIFDDCIEFFSFFNL